MNDRKQHVINMAHQLFIEKGFQSTSIQDILEYSGISKGTFYNYFSSKNELLIALFKAIFTKLEKERNELLIGQDPSDIEIFMKQIELQMKANKKNKLFLLLEEVIVSNDGELKQFMELGKIRLLQWLFNRLVDIFGEEKKPYLLDASIMFLGILQQNLKFFVLTKDSNLSFQQVIRFSVVRLEKMVEELAESGDQLTKPEILETFLPHCKKSDFAFQQKLYHIIVSLKKNLVNHENPTKYIELLDFIHDELKLSKNPRKFVILTTLESLKDNPTISWQKELKKLEQLIQIYDEQLK